MNTTLLRFIKPNVCFYKIRPISQEAVSFSGTLVRPNRKNGLSSERKLLKQFDQQPYSYFCTSSVTGTSFSEKIKNDLSAIKKVDLSQLKCAPVPASLYGFGGIIPFVFPPLYFIVGSYSPFLATAQLVYGATILAFVGGVKWGNALAKDDISHEQIGISTLPSLVAWGSLLVPEPVGILVVSLGLLGALYVDLKSSKYPPWFCAMRLTLTSIATMSLLTTFFFNLFQ